MQLGACDAAIESAWEFDLNESAETESKWQCADPLRDEENKKMDLLIVLIILLLLFGGGGGIYWGLGAGWGVGPIGLLVIVIVAIYLLNGARGRRGPRL